MTVSRVVGKGGCNLLLLVGCTKGGLACCSKWFLSVGCKKSCLSSCLFAVVPFCLVSVVIVMRYLSWSSHVNTLGVGSVHISFHASVWPFLVQMANLKPVALSRLILTMKCFPFSRCLHSSACVQHSLYLSRWRSGTASNARILVAFLSMFRREWKHSSLYVLEEKVRITGAVLKRSLSLC